MSEALVAARTDFPDDDNVGGGGAWRWARGHIVDVKPDGFAWGALEDPRNFGTAAARRFALLRFPGVTLARIQRYLAQQTAIDQFTGRTITVRSRLWQIQWNSLPQAAKNLLIANGMITIGGPTGDFTWAQVQNFFVRLDTGTSDPDPLS